MSLQGPSPNTSAVRWQDPHASPNIPTGTTWEKVNLAICPPREGRSGRGTPILANSLVGPQPKRGKKGKREGARHILLQLMLSFVIVLVPVGI